ncbi:MAG TPA: response regulator transcription factor [Chloroflexota bacterium]|jgi:DNA-binding response OmpR family regulator|nr:response regulator transcription factor [Chloroflexota bacterium]
MAAKKVLVVDDDPIMRDTLAYNLRREGYECFLAVDGTQALGMARTERPDLVLLDLMMPGIDGLEVCRMLRRESDLPILILTAKDDEFDKVLGLEVGADDYITKPFSIRELLARVKAHLRRTEKLLTAGAAAADPLQEIVRGDLRILPAKHEAHMKGRAVRLTAKEYDLLQLLASNPGVVFSRDTLLERVWHFEFPGATTRTVDVHINSLRKKLEPEPSNPRYIETVRGVGYRFVE